MPPIPTASGVFRGYPRGPGGGSLEARPAAGACPAGAPLLMAKAGGKPAGRGISISPALHPPLETTNQGGLGPPIGCTPQSCPTGSLPAAKAYFVTPPPLERRRKRPCFSGAWHRRRPGGPGRYNATVVRACKVIPMRATQGAAAPVTKPPGKLAAMRGWSLRANYNPPPP